MMNPHAMPPRSIIPTPNNWAHKGVGQEGEPVSGGRAGERRCLRGSLSVVQMGGPSQGLLTSAVWLLLVCARRDRTRVLARGGGGVYLLVRVGRRDRDVAVSNRRDRHHRPVQRRGVDLIRALTHHRRRPLRPRRCIISPTQVGGADPCSG